MRRHPGGWKVTFSGAYPMEHRPGMRSILFLLVENAPKIKRFIEYI